MAMVSAFVQYFWPTNVRIYIYIFIYLYIYKCMYSKTNYYFLENLFFSFCSLIDTHAVKIMKREMQFPLSIKAM